MERIYVAVVAFCSIPLAIGLYAFLAKRGVVGKVFGLVAIAFATVFFAAVLHEMMGL